MKESKNLLAGIFSTWLRRTRNAHIHQKGVDVPCGKCKACCTSSYFIHIWPHETTTLSRIPKKLLFPAPGFPKGNMLLGYDENGRCPMLIGGVCSIYDCRPLTCRSYDCRVFAAAGVAPGGADKAQINQHVRRWKFSYPTQLDKSRHLAVNAAAKFLKNHPECFPGGDLPLSSLPLAIQAIKAYRVFLKFGKKSEKVVNTKTNHTIILKKGAP